MKLFTYVLPFSIITLQNFTSDIFCQLHDTAPIYLRERLSAVVSFDGIEDLFLQMYDARLKSYKDSKDPTSKESEGVKQLDLRPDKIKIKEKMCEYILGSDHFKATQVKYANPKSVRIEVKRQPEIYKELWKTSDTKVSWIGGPSDEEGFLQKYENPFRPRAISTKRDKKDEKGKAPEKKDDKKKDETKVFATDKVKVFSCLVRKLEGIFQLYYVSEDYDMNAASSKSSYARPISGRFIFVPNADNKLVVHALAQESTRSLTKTQKVAIEYVYLEKKLTHTTVSKSEEDPICKLNLGQRFRLCSAIFSMKEFSHAYRFFSLPGSVQTDCQQRKISYRSGTVQRKVGGRAGFLEWTFACKPHRSSSVGNMLGGGNDGMVPVSFHVSRGYVNDKVFLHREYGTRIYPEWYLYNTGVVDDVPKPAPKKDEKKDEKKDDADKKKEEKKEGASKIDDHQPLADSIWSWTTGQSSGYPDFRLDNVPYNDRYSWPTTTF